MIEEQEEEEEKLEEIEVLSNSKDKTYMSVYAITDTTSRQYQYIWNSGEVQVNDDGYIVSDDGHIGAALGSRFGPVGTKYIFYLRDGDELKELRIVKVEEKADRDTKDGWMAHDGHVIEFVVDPSRMTEYTGGNGLIYNGNFNNCKRFRGEIERICMVKE